MKQLLPNSTHVTVQEAGHAVYLEQPNIFFKSAHILAGRYFKGGRKMSFNWQTEKVYEEIKYESYEGIAKLRLIVQKYIMHLHQKR